MRSIGQCRLIAELGSGGMANVYLAATQGSGGVQKLIVLKALRAELASEPDALGMFLDEARLATQLNHPNVVQTYDVGTHEDRSVMVMEYLEGQPLSRLIRQCQIAGTPMSLEMGLRIVMAALEGLHYAHELTGYDGTPLELVHRDISPQNIFVTYTGQVKVLDFGIAKAANSSTQTAAGVVKGKFTYMAPEQMSGEAVDRRADIYSVGCMLWAFATGKKLWTGEADGKVLRRVLSGEVPSPLSENPDCDPELSEIIERAMAHDREKRYATALDLQTALEHYCDRKGWRVKPKEIGKLTSELFASTRQRIRDLIEEQLAKEPSNDVSPNLQLIEERSIVSSPSAVAISQNSTQPSPRPRSKVPYFLALGAVALLGSAWALTKGLPTISGEPPAAPTRAAVVSSPPPTVVVTAPAPPKEARTIAVRFRVKPEDAQLFLDDVPLPPQADPRSMLLEGSKHTLRAESRGYNTGSLQFTASQGAELELSLAKAAEPEKPKAPPPRVIYRPAPVKAEAKPATPPPAAAPAPAPAKPNCSAPFFFDENGIKRVRPECR